MSASDIIEVLEYEAQFVVPLVAPLLVLRLVVPLRVVRLVVPLLVAALFVALPASAQSPLSLSEAIVRARAHNPDAGSAAAAEREAAERVHRLAAATSQRWTSRSPGSAAITRCSCSVRCLRSGSSPRPTSPWMRSITPVPRTTSARHSPSSSRCSIGPSRRTPSRVDWAGHGGDRQATRLPRPDGGGDRRVGRVLIAAATARSAAAAVETARADRELAVNRRDAGRVTDADVLQLDVYLARTLEQQVEATSEERIARARLNQLMGEPLKRCSRSN